MVKIIFCLHQNQIILFGSNIKMTVIAINDVFVDAQKCFEARGVLMDMDISYKQWGLSIPREDGTPILTLSKDNFSSAFLYLQRKVLGFFLNSGESVVFHYDESDNYIQVFCMTMILTGGFKELMNCGNLADVQSFLQKRKDGEAIYELVRKNLGVQSVKDICCSLTDNLQCVDKVIFPFVVPYVDFVSHCLKSRIFKKKKAISLLQAETFPKLMNLLGPRFKQDSRTYAVLLAYLFHHACRNPGCDGFSQVKCDDCKVAYYCNVYCQEEDWDHHQEICQDMKALHERMHLIPRIVENEFKKIIPDKSSIISFRLFAREVAYRVYQMFYGGLKNETFARGIQLLMANNIPPKCLPSHQVDKSRSKMLTLLKESSGNTIRDTADITKKVFGKKSNLHVLLDSLRKKSPNVSAKIENVELLRY